MMQLTVLGASPACQNPGGACSGYLLEQDGTAVLIDCGAGVFSRLQRYVEPERVQAIIVSHTHADHTLDLIQYRYFLQFLPSLGRGTRRPALLLPPDGHQRLLTVINQQDPSATFYSSVFDVREYDPAATLNIGPLSVRFTPVVHIPHTYAMRIRGEALLAFSADSGPCEALPEVARDSDLFLCECANSEGSDFPYHLTPRQAATYARAGGARRLLLTHRWWAYGKEETVQEAASIFNGLTELAHEDQRIILAP